MTTEAPPPQSGSDALPNAPGEPDYPEAQPLPPSDNRTPIQFGADNRQSVRNGVYTLDGHAEIVYRDRILEADHIEYDSNTGDVTLTGHIVLSESDNDVRIEADHGAFNVHDQTGRFYDVSGSMGLQHRPSQGTALVAQRVVYSNGNPFLFTGKLVTKTGPREYHIYGGTVTSCQLPRPDWQFAAGEFSVNGDTARAKNSVFRLHGIPILWLPYATHPTDASARQTGLLVPEIGVNSASKGNTVGEQVYWAINRSTDLTLGFIYYSARGWEELGSFRYRGLGQSFARARFSSLQDRGYTPVGGSYINQRGTDVLFSGRYDVENDGPASKSQTRFVGDVEYLSSFPYREAFSTNFNQAVSSDVNSAVYATHEWNGMAASLEADRYQGEKRVPTPTRPEQQLRIFHAPSLEFTTTDHALGSTGLEWRFDGSATGLKRVQPNFTTSGIIERVDLHPELAYPLHAGEWSVRPSIGGRETFYSRSRVAGTFGLGVPPVENTGSLNRADFEAQVDVRPPVLERTFHAGPLTRLLGHDVKHTIEPELTYRYVTGVDNFSSVLRFDTTDVVSNTNELRYGVTQRLFLRRASGEPCRAAGTGADAAELLGSAGTPEDSAAEPGESGLRPGQRDTVCGNREWISWYVAQKYFFNSDFGGAVTNGPRTVLATALDFSGISFLTRPRSVSPLISRLRVRTSEHTDVEWDFDYDPCTQPVVPVGAPPSRECDNRFTASNLYVDVHRGNLFSGIGYARLNAPGRSYVEGLSSPVAEFNQMRVLFGFGKPTRRGLNAAAYTGLDLDLGTVQYGAVQTSYNWNCCGVSIEYRKYELGTARNDNGYRFNFTLANIGSAGNLRHTDQIF